MHSRQKLWLHGVVTRSLYGSRQMMHSPPTAAARPSVGAALRGRYENLQEAAHGPLAAARRPAAPAHALQPRGVPQE